ncbi:hypothetical protein SOCE26_087270 [Sorangium cellulosum]|uniref:Lipoprotein n=1 Tax=Sorangium cellulosum TaxID=56 RepID=A0A2L0F6L8_SORCE|nr:hypothetical protein [Sorangium cellulosum]AUX47215.1 hypothetical protein SOCE26_087270 [Sorangium cellulosum]
MNLLSRRCRNALDSLCIPALSARAGVALAAALSLGASSCASIVGEHEAETKFLVKPSTQAKFSGWSEVSVSQDPSSVDGAKLMFIRLEARDNNVPDLTFIKSITAEAVVDGAATKIAGKSPMPTGERIVPLDRAYHGDIRKFFYEDTENGGYTVHVDWRGELDLTKKIPEEGVWMKVIVAVSIE